MLKKIHIDDLEVGMFVEKYGAGTFREPLAFPRLEVVSVEQIDFFRKNGAVDVFIDVSKSAGGVVEVWPEEPVEFVGLERKVAFADEIPVASKVYAEAVRHAREIMEAARQSGRIDYSASTALVEGMVASVERNESAAVSLSRLRARDEYHYTHAVNVSLLAIVFGKHLGLGQSQVRDLGMAGLYHDIGKACLPESILNKPGKLSLWEEKIAHSHSVEGYRLLKGQPDVPQAVLHAVLEHHERFDGKGYPRGLADGEMHLFARVVSIVDVFDAITSDRPYAKAKPAAEAFRVMYSMRNKDFGANYLEHFIKSLGIFPVGSFVRLNNGHYAVVCEANSDQPLRPSVKVVFDAKFRPRRAEVVDLAQAQATDLADRLEIVESLDPRAHRIDVMRLLT